jgi:predicted O-linked N-acetylglucosamine transferase (SPINDLY family)
LVDPKLIARHAPAHRLSIRRFSRTCHHALAAGRASSGHAQFETYLYSFGPDLNDACRQRARNTCEKFIDIRSLSDKAAAESIARDEIDILVDLKGYTTDSRLGISAWRPAPVLVSWLGYPGTLGHQRMADYIIGDPIVTPVVHADHFSETWP